MKKKVPAMLLAAVMAFSLLPAAAFAANAAIHDNSVSTEPEKPAAPGPGGDFEIDNGVLTKYTGSGGAVVIPDNVTSIGNYVFMGYANLTSVVIPGGVTSIGTAAFSSCGNLTSVTIPDSVTSIGMAAFSGCGSLTGVTIPAGVTKIDDAVFADCTSLTGVTIPAGVTSIGYSAFQRCTSLTGVVIPAGVTFINPEAFYDCTSLKSVTIPASVTAIGLTAFGRSGLTDIYYGGSAEQWNAILVSDDYGVYPMSGTFTGAAIHYNSAGPDTAQPTEPTQPAAPVAEFRDVPEDAWCAGAVAWAVENGVTNGYGGGVFGPDYKCTNEQVLTFLYRAVEKKGAASAGDVDKAVNWAREKNMISDGFDRGAYCTRSGAVMYLWQALGSTAPTQGSSFTDVPAGAPYAGAVAWAVEKGVTNGYSASHFGPGDTCTRGQIVTFLYRGMAD